MKNPYAKRIRVNVKQHFSSAGIIQIRLTKGNPLSAWNSQAALATSPFIFYY